MNIGDPIKKAYSGHVGHWVKVDTIGNAHSHTGLLRCVDADFFILRPTLINESIDSGEGETIYRLEKNIPTPIQSINVETAYTITEETINELLEKYPMPIRFKILNPFFFFFYKFF